MEPIFGFFMVQFDQAEVHLFTIDVVKARYIKMFSKKIMSEDFLFQKNNSLTGFTSSYLGKRSKFAFDLCIEVKIDSRSEAECRRAIFLMVFFQYFIFVKSFVNLVSHILDIT